VLLKRPLAVVARPTTKYAFVFHHRYDGVTTRINAGELRLSRLLFLAAVGRAAASSRLGRNMPARCAARR